MTETTNTEAPKAETPKERVSSLLREAGTVAIALGFALIVRTVAAEPFNVPSSSMVPTLLVGDTLIAGKYTYGYSKFSAPFDLLPNFKGRILEHAPKRGDVVVFRLPRDTSINYVKRLIGLPGDRIQMKEGRLYINGEIVPRVEDGTYTTNFNGRARSVNRYIETLPGGVAHTILEISDNNAYDSTAEYVVPPKHYFMMGDNRDNSLDSRVPPEDDGVGYVPEENLIGRVDRIMYSRDMDVPWWNVPEIVHSIRPERILAAVK
jgi:signal peptidase I